METECDQKGESCGRGGYLSGEAGRQADGGGIFGISRDHQVLF